MGACRERVALSWPGGVFLQVSVRQSTGAGRYLSLVIEKAPFFAGSRQQGARDKIGEGGAAQNSKSRSRPELATYLGTRTLVFQQQMAWLAQSVERETLNLKVAGSTPVS